MMASEIIKELIKYSNPEKAKLLSGFFKTGKGEYGEGDIFIGVTVPEIRKIAKKYYEISLDELEKLISSNIHEERLCCLLILVKKFEVGDEKTRKDIYDFYTKNAKRINNWDLVDLTAHKIVGEWLTNRDRKILYELAKSGNLWERRISIISCFAFLRKNDYKDALEISKILMADSHDLIHKAVGWVLREVGKKDLDVEEKFLKENGRYKKMPRTMLRYAIEKFDEEKRKKYLRGEI
ncbi:DNA alkylation repair protein [Candidatus Pacearchaeota archaeon CG10_big_fil_rev_8_21_14_0_10_32_14]|nr:MAG: DNA alkylation repair protein [Candidatus Pacearchaeota archaeon CG10_big_fil_rev_8_21_14_0_10_32_14]